jgi:glycosyltransferase involved in cell wall biosynthesis
MGEPVIASPMASGSGAYVVHKLLERSVPGYRVLAYDPRWAFFPPALCRFRDSRAALVHTAPDYAIFAADPKTPLVVTFHNYVLDPFMRAYSSFAQRVHYRFDLRWWTLAALRRADAVTAVSRYTAELVKRDTGYEGDIRVIYNGVDTSAFKPANSARTDDGRIKVLFSGNLTSRKGANLLPRIAELVAPNVKILYTQGLRGGRRLPPHPRLECLGPIPFEAMPDVYREADLLLYPSVREGFGLGVAEAMASGLPVVATDCSSIPELTEHGRGGFLCPVDSAEGFAQAINTLAASAPLRKTFGEFNRDRAEREFPLRRMIEGYQALFAELLQRGRAYARVS